MGSSVMLTVLFSMQWWSSAFVMGDTPALFVFGDSLVDVGNNNFINTNSRANYVPYGINFPNHTPTGRFSDGMLVPDYIATYLNISYPPPYLEAGNNIQQGANFGSGGSGIIESTGMGTEHRPLARQVQDFRTLKQTLNELIGSENASSLISKSIFYITSANNDISGNYFNNVELQRNYSLSQFEDLLVSILGQQIQELYRLGARKFFVTSVAALGCNPLSLYTYRITTPGECVAVLDSAAQSYIQKQQALFDELNSSLRGVTIVFGNLYNIMMLVIKNGQTYGFEVVNQPCCPRGGYLGCFMYAPICNNASNHVFWDLYHPTGTFNRFIARRFWGGDTGDVSPINLRRLAGRNPPS